MRIASPSRPTVTVRTDKEERLKDFVGEGLARSAEEPARDMSVTAFLRNPDSPAARALSAVCQEGRAEGARIRVLICDTNVDEPLPASVMDIAGAEFRIFSHSRFAAAHEQLVVGRRRVWIGDCLRRDPTKRDAFEVFHLEDEATHLFATISFERLWALGRPIKPSPAESVSAELIAAGRAVSEPGSLPPNPRH